MTLSRYLFPTLLVAGLAGCREKRLIPPPDAGWMPIGGTAGSVTALDTSRIVPDGDARIVWLRIDSIAPDTAGKPVYVPGSRRETLHRIRCGALTVEDLRPPVPSGGAPVAADLIATGRHTFATHPLGDETFPTVCSMLGVVANIRAGEQAD